MRGKEGTFHWFLRCDRITPAYAGKSFRGDLLWKLLMDHPRLCGEKKGYALEQVSTMGSPPPMRGKVFSLYSFRVHA